MRLYKKEFTTWKNSIDILPSLLVRWNEATYIHKSFSIEFHWIIYHARLLWLEED